MDDISKLQAENEKLNGMLDKWIAEHDPAVLKMGNQIQELKAENKELEALCREMAVSGQELVDKITDDRIGGSLFRGLGHAFVTGTLFMLFRRNDGVLTAKKITVEEDLTPRATEGGK